MKRSWQLSTILVLALIVAACGGQTAQAPAPTTAPAAKPAAPTTAPAAPTTAPAAKPANTEAPKAAAPAATTAPAAKAAATEAPKAAAPAAPAAGISASDLGTLAGKSGSLALWHGWRDTEEATLKEALAELQKLNPNVKVELLAVPFDQLQNKFQTEASAGGGPDILIGPADWIGPFQKAQLIADVGKAAYLDRFIAPAANALKVSGKQYAIPESVEAVALYYNKDKVKTPPAKVEDLLKEAETNGAAWHNGFYQNVGYLYAHGGKLFNDNYKVVFDDANGAQWLTFMSNLCKTKNVTCDGDDAKLDALFKQGQVAFRNNGPWALGDYKKALGDKLGVVPLPAAANPASPFLGTKNFMVNANSKNQDLALAFLDYMTSNGVQTVFMNKAGHLPANKNVDVSRSPDAAGFVKQATTAVPQPTVPEMGKVWEPAGNAIQEVLQGKKQPQAALTDAAKLINAANNKQ